jgi:hypothetical protein
MVECERLTTKEAGRTMQLRAAAGLRDSRNKEKETVRYNF